MHVNNLTIFLAIILLLLCQIMQGQSKVDTLQTLLLAAQDDSSKVSLVIDLSDEYLKSSPIKSLNMLEDALVLVNTSKQLHDTISIKFKNVILNLLGEGYSLVGDDKKQLNCLLKVLKLTQKNGNTMLYAEALNNLGNVHQNQLMYDEAVQYYRKALIFFQQISDMNGQVATLGNIGNCISVSNPDSAGIYFMTALSILNHPDMEDREAAMGWMMQNIGNWHWQHNQIDSAFYYFHLSAKIRESIDHRLGLQSVYNNLAGLYQKVGKSKDALRYADKGIQQGEENNLIRFLYYNYVLRSEIKSSLGDYKGAYEDHKYYILLRDSVQGEEKAKALIQQAMTYEYNKKHLSDSLLYEADRMVQAKEIRNQKIIRNGFMMGFVLVALFAIAFLFQRNKISKEKARSDELLHNILPQQVAQELKEKGKVGSKRIEQVTVLFTDFKGFTAMAEQLTPKDLVEDLNTCFSKFDAIIEKYGIEKIKTIGDAYMAAGGLPLPDHLHAKHVVQAALEMREFIKTFKAEKVQAGLPYFEIRIGMHTGPVVAGVVGVKKFQYDIWGDTVNTSSRMESSGEIGKVNISQTTYELLKDDPSFTFESRGKVKAKGKGEIEMYFVDLNTDVEII